MFLLYCMYKWTTADTKGRGWRGETGLSPPPPVIFTDRSKVVRLVPFSLLLVKSIYEFMLPVALFENFGGLTFISSIIVSHVTAHFINAPPPQ